MQLPFAKYSGAGNDFILFDNRDGEISLTKEGVIKLCSRQRGVGGDGVLLLEKSDSNNFKMRIFNSDGSEAEMCGNGLRCIAEHIRRLRLIEGDACIIESMARQHTVSWCDKSINVDMGVPKDIRWHVNLALPTQYLTLSYLDTGVPHAVIFCEDIRDINVAEIAPQIRYHHDFSPRGTNVNFAQVKNDEVYLRTYERGVERETAGCGTGAVATAIAASKKFGLSPPVTIRLQSGDSLSINFIWQGDTISHIKMSGPANHLFDGTVTLSRS